MDPFTQRMLERAKARREKLDTQLSNAGHDVKKRRSPLKDANAILAQATVPKSDGVKDITPTKSPSKPSVDDVPVTKSPRKSPLKNVDENNDQIDKENGDIGICSVKTKLQRLGKLYSDDESRELSSPIHRTEEKFNAEDQVERKPAKRGARLDRLAALASTINNWEDDLSHPNLVKPQPSTSGCSKWSIQNNKNKEASPTKQLKWDKATLDSLEAQGFNRTKSNTRLVYDYKRCSQESSPGSSKSSNTLCPDDKKKQGGKSPESKFLGTQQNKKVQEDKTKSNSPANSPRSNNDKNQNSPEKTAKRSTPTGAGNKLISRVGYNGSPRKSPVQTAGSVLSKASMFESRSQETKAKDPAQMSLSERMALFERNKGEALIPKAPLTMSVPPKKLQEKEKSTESNVRPKVDIPNKTVGTQRAIFEQGHTQELENNVGRSAHMERQRELDMLRSRFNRNKEMAQVAAGSCIRTSESSEGKSNSPKNSPICPVKPTPAPEYVAPPPPPPLPQSLNVDEATVTHQNKASPIKRQGTSTQVSVQPKVARPKPGHLYPSLSELENSTETETDIEYTVDSTEPETATLDEKTESETPTEAEYYVHDNESETDSEDEDSEEVNTSLGRSILRAVNQQALMNKKRAIDPDPDSTTSDISVLDEMDEYLDECLAKQEGYLRNISKEEGPTPPKLNKATKVNKADKNLSATSNSFKYMDGSPYRSPIKVVSPTTPKQNEPYVIEGDNCLPLMHSVSFYRRQQSQTPKTPVRTISRTVDIIDTAPDSAQSDDEIETQLVQDKIRRLLDEVSIQQTIIGQASQALNLCTSTIEFSGSREQVEGERSLLIATHKRQAAVNEIQRLKVEGTLRPVVPGAPEVQESGTLTVSAITLPLKREYFRSVDSNTCLYFVCLMRHLEEVVATPVVVAQSGDSCLRFPSTLKLQHLYSDFKITVELYSLQTQAEMLPHEIKYHIHNSSGSSNINVSGNSKKVNKTPKKFLKQESRLIMPSVQSPAGPTAVRSPAFQFAGYVIFSLKEVHRQQFTLNKIPRQSPLEGHLQMHVSCELSVSVEHRGFLTMFEDVSGFGAWHRRWCLLKGATLSYWKYPDDERKKTPIGSLDLQTVSTINVGLVSRDICARPNTFLLESVRPAQSSDADSLVLIKNGAQTTIRHLLSADTKEDRLEWCSKLNKTLSLIRAWGGTSGSS